MTEKLVPVPHGFKLERVPWRPACIALGVFYVSGGLGFIDPVKGARIYGFNLSPKEARIYPAAAIRNVSLGATILAFVATNQSQALGTLLLGFSIMAVGDMAIVLRAPGVEAASLAMHAAKLVAMPVIGAKLLNWW